MAGFSLNHFYPPFPGEGLRVGVSSTIIPSWPGQGRGWRWERLPHLIPGIIFSYLDFLIKFFLYFCRF